MSTPQSISYMSQLQLECSTEDARELVKEAFRRTEGISTIEQEGYQIVGKTGVSFPRILWSYGENIYVDFSDPTEDGEVPIEVWAEKSIWTNITADPQKYKRRFLGELENIRGESIEKLQKESVEVATPQSSTSSWEAIGYPVSIVIGAFVGLTISMFLMSAIFGRLVDSGGILGILAGGMSGVALWYNRKNPSLRTAATYVGLAIVGFILTGFINTGLNLADLVGTALLVVLTVGIPVGVYLKRNQSSSIL